MAAKKKASKVYGSKTSFVMGLPRDMSAKEVIKRAKAQGLALSEAHVYKIRSTNKDKAKSKPASKAVAPKGETKGRSSKANGDAAEAAAPSPAATSSMSKRDFVLSFGSSTPAAEILAQAKARGLSLSKAYLYTIRSNKAPNKAPKDKAGPAPRARAAGASRDLEAQLIDVALDLGLARATQLLDRVRSKLKEGL
jgi:hypothetical protein